MDLDNINAKVSSDEYKADTVKCSRRAEQNIPPAAFLMGRFISLYLARFDFSALCVFEEMEVSI